MSFKNIESNFWWEGDINQSKEVQLIIKCKEENLNNVCIQGGMNPELLLKSEENVLKETEKYLEIFKNNPYIFNLGHGILPETKIEMVEELVKIVRDFT